MSFKSFAGLVILSLSLQAHAAIGPVTDLHIVNANIQPDGFTRPAVLAEGTFPVTLVGASPGPSMMTGVSHATQDDDENHRFEEQEERGLMRALGLEFDEIARRARDE